MFGVSCWKGEESSESFKFLVVFDICWTATLASKLAATEAGGPIVARNGSPALART